MSQKNEQNEQWGSRLGFIMAAMGMAVGTGNIWRFPRMAGTNGGGTFVLIYILANLVWAAPLMITEMALGRKYKLGTAGAFREWMGCMDLLGMRSYNILLCSSVWAGYEILLVWPRGSIQAWAGYTAIVG